MSARVTPATVYPNKFDPQVHAHPCAYCGREILKRRKVYCSSTCSGKAAYRRSRGDKA